MYIAYVHVKRESMVHQHTCVCVCVCVRVCACNVSATQANKNGPPGDRSDIGGRRSGQSTPRTFPYGRSSAE